MPAMPKLLPDSERVPRRAAFLIGLLAPLAAILLHLLPALLCGLVIYTLVRIMAPRLEQSLSTHNSRVAVIALLAFALVAALAGLILGLLAFFRSDAGSISALLQHMADLIESSRSWLPGWIDVYLPDDSSTLKASLAAWLRQHGGELQTVGTHTARSLAYAVLGMIIGALIALRKSEATAARGPLLLDLAAHANNFQHAFHDVVFAQVQIAAINAAITAVYLLVMLPLLGIHLPLAKTMVALTFVAGLLPIVGNLVSNSVIVVISLAHSLALALISLVVLVVIHKLEYFLNARIIGERIKAHSWELLCAMLVMEAAFGLPGLVLAPIYYAFLKTEVERRGWL